MKKKLFLYISLFTALLYACSPETGTDTPEDGLLIETHLSATMTGSRVALDGTLLNPFWQDGDKIAVYDGEALREFTLLSGEGTANAVFTGKMSSSATNLKAVYPFSAAKLEGSTLSCEPPAEQTVVSSGADPEALVMYGEAPVGSSVRFSNQCALLRFSAFEGVSSVIFEMDDYRVTVNLPGTAGSFAVAIKPGDYYGLTAYIRTSGSSYYMESSMPWSIESGHSLSLGELSSSDPVLIISNADEMLAFLSSTSAGDKSQVRIIDDIDLSGKDIPTASGFGGILSGFSHVVNVGVTSKPLFATNDGNISSLVLDGTFNASSLVCAPLVLTNNGRLTTVTNKVSVAYSTSAPVSVPIVMGGITAYNYGTLISCSNEGSVSFTSTSSITGAALGGICGYSEGELKNCSNKGKLSLSAKYGSGMCAIGKITSSAANMGGIAGAAFEGFSATSCTNTGEIVFINDAIDNCTGIYQRSQIGGIAGSPYGPISKCNNSGHISVTATTTSRAAYSANNYIFDIGGISGGSFHETADYQAVNDHTDISSCSNEGDIDFCFDASKSNSPVGGIVGWPNGEHTGIACKTSDCNNSGNITMSGAGKVRVGGIMGGTGAIENCNNSGRLYVKSADSGSTLGGINAFHSQDHALYKCINTGDVISDIALYGTGGLIGCHGGVDLTSSLSCKVLCNVVSGAGDRSGTGMVLGTYNKETNKNVVLGSSGEPIEVRGTVSVAGVPVELNKNNFNSYLAGTTYLSDTHIIYAYCDTPGPETYAEGTVKYSDGTVASGVSVSDGFSVAVTDSQGKYHLTTCPDSWYIYISMPSDAVIAKKSDGRPDFFITYSGTASNYNFILTRQAVENEFLLFAMADPQSHYSNRGTGLSDTERFNREAVPAINAHIAEQSLPCYGVTLGDIVYSEGTRNSNAGMATMRTLCGKINMPIFQTMGNHDFTFFSSSSPLSTDSRTSTLYLRAQRKFEDTFGPINFSFNRGDVHVVCMRNIIYNSTTDASDYVVGYTDEQWAWLKADLANVPKTKMVILCGHIPLTGKTGASYKHVNDVISLIKQYKNSQVFSGHTHYKRYASVGGVPEHIHAAVCGQWWWSNVEGDGVPNGYTVYRLNGTSLTDEYSMGMNTHMNTRDYQMRIYRGNLTNGGSYAKFRWPYDASRLFINVFNGDSRWKVKVYENGVLSGNATLMSPSRQYWEKITQGNTYDINTSSSQDWWAIAYHIGVRGRGLSSTSYYTSMYHMFTYTLKDASATVKVEATDGYGNTYTCTDVIKTDSYYPNYMKFGNAD